MSTEPEKIVESEPKVEVEKEEAEKKVEGTFWLTGGSV